MSEATFDIGAGTVDSFDALVDAKVAASLADQSAGETEAAVETAEAVTPARNERGQFTKEQAEDATTVDDDTAPTVEPDDEEAERTEPESPEPQANAELEELRRRLAEKDEFIGRQSGELGELRRLVEQVATQQQQQLAQTRPPVDQDALIDLYVGDPNRGLADAQAALQRGDWDGYDVALDALTEAGHARIARRYERHVNAWLAEQRALAQTAPLQQNARETENAQAVANVGAKYPDFEPVLRALTHVPPNLEQALTSAPNAAAYEDALDTLYHYARSVQTGPLKDAAKKAAQEADQEARQAKVEATVASATKTPVRDEPSLSKAILAEMLSVNEPFQNAWSHDE